MNQRRGLFVLVVVVGIVAAAVAGRAAVSTSKPARAKAANTVWFCPGVPTSLAPDARLTVSNVGSTAADVVVTFLLDNGSSAPSTFQVAPNTVVTKRGGVFAQPGALTIESFGGTIVVEQGADTTMGHALSPCATQASTEWYFAAGETPRGVQQWLLVDNPYAADAKIDVTLRDANGLRQPESLLGYDVPRRTRAVIALHAPGIAVREDRLAVQVVAREGTVVAAQTLIFTNDAGAPGIAHTIGTPGASDHWMFANGSANASTQTTLALTNVGTDDTSVDVQVVPENNKTVNPITVPVSQDQTILVTLGRCSGANCIALADNTRYAIDVRAEHGILIVAQTLTRSTSPTAPGADTAIGVAQPNASWHFATTRVQHESATTISIFNPLAQPAQVNVALARNGGVERPRALQAISVPAGRAVTVTIVNARTRPTTDAALIVDATSAVVVDRTFLG